MKNIPERIFLNIQEECMDEFEDFEELVRVGGVSWSEHNIYKTDVEYVRKKSPWISTNDRLPEENEKVFFVLLFRGIHKEILAGIYREYKWETERRIYKSSSFDGIVTHWMPIPEFNR